jgi:hypothetical protein
MRNPLAPLTSTIQFTLRAVSAATGMEDSFSTSLKSGGVCGQMSYGVH